MKKWLPYMLGFLGLLVLLLLVLYAPRPAAPIFDARVTLRPGDKIPYGTYVAQQFLKASFLKAHIVTSKAAPGFWNDIDLNAPNQAVFLVCKTFDPEPHELVALRDFAAHGNTVFLSTRDLSADAAAFFGVSQSEPFLINHFNDDTLQVAIAPGFDGGASYLYPGRRFEGALTAYDTARAAVLGVNELNDPDLLQMRAGNGHFFLHLAPLAFSNYFLLHKFNSRYFQKLMAFMPRNLGTVVWDEYYLTHRKQQQEAEPNMLRVLWQYPAFRWALVVAGCTLLIYVLSGMRRQQQPIPAYAPPVNDSLEFVRTMGRLYYNQRDHHNLAAKMGTYFLETARARYKILAPPDDPLFAAGLAAKSGLPQSDIVPIAEFLNYLEQYTFITEAELARFYNQLQTFYQKTGHGTFV